MERRATETYLLAWHAEHTGATRDVLSDLTDEDGRSSYWLLAQDAGDADVVLDLPCGDGPLLELLSASSLVARR